MLNLEQSVSNLFIFIDVGQDRIRMSMVLISSMILHTLFQSKKLYYHPLYVIIRQKDA